MTEDVFQRNQEQQDALDEKIKFETKLIEAMTDIGFRRYMVKNMQTLYHDIEALKACNKALANYIDEVM
jgi:polyhydroxyalkanoate synthesis regulator phasin